MKSFLFASLNLPLLTTLALSLPQIQTDSSGTLHIPLKRSVQQVRNLDTLHSEAEFVRSRHGVVSFENLSKRSNLLLTNLKNSQFTAEILIGTPPQPLNVVMDTGSTPLIIVGSNCTNCVSTLPKYSASASNTSHMTRTENTLRYGSMTAFGYLGKENVTFGGFSYEQIDFTATTNRMGSNSATASGILGLGVSPNRPYNLVQALAAEGRLSSQIFSFAFESYNGIDQAVAKPVGGMMTIGGVNSSHYTGDINWIPTVGSTYWSIPLQGMSTDNKTFDFSSSSVVIDTGTTLIGGPSDAVKAVYAGIPGSAPMTVQNTKGYYAYPCNSTVNVSFKFGNVMYPIESDYFPYAFVDSTNQTCIGALFDLEADGSIIGSKVSWIFGVSFLNGVYSAYRFGDSPAVGFASRGTGGVVAAYANSTFVARSQAVHQISTHLFNNVCMVLSFVVAFLMLGN